MTEQFERWNKLLAGLNEERITAPSFDYDWSIKDVIAHLWARQQISVARLESGALEREPDFPPWVTEIGEDWEEDADRDNALTFERNHANPWSEVYENWRNGFLRFLELGGKVSERDLLDGDRYPWLKGISLAFILIASYDHHQEHFEKLHDWLESHGD